MSINRFSSPQPVRQNTKNFRRKLNSVQTQTNLDQVQTQTNLIIKFRKNYDDLCSRFNKFKQTITQEDAERLIKFQGEITQFETQNNQTLTEHQKIQVKDIKKRLSLWIKKFEANAEKQALLNTLNARVFSFRKCLDQEKDFDKFIKRIKDAIQDQKTKQKAFKKKHQSIVFDWQQEESLLDELRTISQDLESRKKDQELSAIISRRLEYWKFIHCSLSESTSVTDLTIHFKKLTQEINTINQWNRQIRTQRVQQEIKTALQKIQDIKVALETKLRRKKIQEANAEKQNLLNDLNAQVSSFREYLRQEVIDFDTFIKRIKDAIQNEKIKQKALQDKHQSITFDWRQEIALLDQLRTISQDMESRKTKDQELSAIISRRLEYWKFIHCSLSESTSVTDLTIHFKKLTQEINTINQWNRQIRTQRVQQEIKTALQKIQDIKVALETKLRRKKIQEANAEKQNLLNDLNAQVSSFREYLRQEVIDFDTFIKRIKDAIQNEKIKQKALQDKHQSITFDWRQEIALLDQLRTISQDLEARKNNQANSRQHQQSPLRSNSIQKVKDLTVDQRMEIIEYIHMKINFESSDFKDVRRAKFNQLITLLTAELTDFRSFLQGDKRIIKRNLTLLFHSDKLPYSNQTIKEKANALTMLVSEFM